MLPAPRGGSRCDGLKGFGLRRCWGWHGGSEVEDGLCLLEGTGCCEFWGACNVAARYRGDLSIFLRSSLSCGSRRRGSNQVEVSSSLRAECEERPWTTNTRNQLLPTRTVSPKPKVRARLGLGVRMSIYYLPPYHRATLPYTTEYDDLGIMSGKKAWLI